MSEQQFLQHLENLSPDSVCLAERKPFRIQTHLDYDKMHVDTRIKGIPPSIAELAAESKSPEELRVKIENIHFSHIDIQNIEQATRIQRSNIWFEQRNGRLTASNFHRASTRLKTYVKDKCDTSCATSDILGYSQPPKEKTAYGYKNENIAAVKYEELLIQKGHKQVKVSECGLFVGKNEPYLGASPDRIVTCECCPQRVLEIKCPTVGEEEQISPKNVTYLYEKNDTMFLKENHAYYTQVQGQMYFTCLKQADFFVFCKSGLSHLETIQFDRAFWSSILGDLKLYYHAFVIPELVTKRIKQKRKSDNATQTCTNKFDQISTGSKGASKSNAKKGKSKRTVKFKPVYLCGKCNKKCIEIDDETTDHTENSIYCDSCHAWFHWLCEGIHDYNDDAFEDDKYICRSCIRDQIGDAMDTS